MACEGELPRPRAALALGKSDLSDLEDVVEWALTHTAEAEAIVANAKALFQRAATPEHTARPVAAALASARA